MKIKETTIAVGKRAADDKRKLDLPGTLITPDTQSDTLLLVLCGFSGHQEHYVEFFGKQMGAEFSVYISEMRGRGLCNTDRCIDDFAQIDSTMRDEIETDRVFYIAHSMGMPISVAAKNRHGLNVAGLYGISTFPSIGDTRTKDPDIQIKSLQHRLLDSLAGINYGPLGVQLDDEEISEPVRFAIAGQDEVTGTTHPATAERFVSSFNRYPDSSSKIFAGKNHCFNKRRRDYKPFNKDDPEILVSDVKEFVYRTIDEKYL